MLPPFGSKQHRGQLPHVTAVEAGQVNQSWVQGPDQILHLQPVSPEILGLGQLLRRKRLNLRQQRLPLLGRQVAFKRIKVKTRLSTGWLW